MRNLARFLSRVRIAFVIGSVLGLASVGLARSTLPTEPTLVVRGGLNPPARILNVICGDPQTKLFTTFDVPALGVQDRQELKLQAAPDWLRTVGVTLQWQENQSLVNDLRVALLLDVDRRQIMLPLKSDGSLTAFRVDEEHYNRLNAALQGRLSTLTTARLALMSVSFKDGREWAPTIGYYGHRRTPEGLPVIDSEDLKPSGDGTVVEEGGHR